MSMTGRWFIAASLRTSHLTVPEAARDMVVHHAHGLHERVADGGADESEPALLEVLAHGLRCGGLRGELTEAFPSVLDRPAVHEAPQIGIERTELIADVERRSGVGDGGLDLHAVADDPGVLP